MKKKLQVFVSSTYQDMIAERQAAIEAILDAGHIPAGMELFAAANESQMETIRRWINDSDVFMLILGGRYGSIESKTGKSYIHLEYEHALKTKKPYFAAVIMNDLLDQKVRQNGSSAIEVTNGSSFAQFKSIVLGNTSRFFGNMDQLKNIVLSSLKHIENTEDLVGWIRGSEFVDPRATLDENSKLKDENNSLRKRVEEFEFAAKMANRSPERIASQLSKEAKELLVFAAQVDGSICKHSRQQEDLYFTTISSGQGNAIFQSLLPGRELATYLSVLDELFEHGLVKSRFSETGDAKRDMTRLGYDVVDAIKAANVKIVVKQI